MGASSKIEWTATVNADGSVTPGATWNPIRARNRETGKIGWFCTHVSEGCRNCYAETINRRVGTGTDYKAQLLDRVELFLDEKMLLAPLHWRKPRKIFVGSMTDLFGEFVPDEMIDRIFAVMALCPQHTFQVLSKRSARMCLYIAAEDVHLRAGTVCAEMWKAPLLKEEWPLRNVWLGVSCENQATADARIPHLLDTPAAIRFLSCEPLLGPIALTRLRGPDYDWYDALEGRMHEHPSVSRGHPKIDWVIAGGESGPGARPMHPDWARSIRDQCARADATFFFKQWGEWAPHQPVAGGDLGGDVRGGRVRIVHPTGQTDVEIATATGGRNTIPGSRYMARLGKSRAGRLLDGALHDGFPEGGTAP